MTSRYIDPTMATSTSELIDLSVMAQAAECLRTLAHPVRLRIVQMLLHDSYSVGELAEACEIANHMASEHLRLMQHCGFLSRRKEGRFTYYEIAEPHLQDIMNCIVGRFGDAK